MPDSLKSLIALSLSALTACSAPSEGPAPPRERWSARLDAPVGEALIVRGDHRLAPGEYLTVPIGREGRRGVVRLEGLEDATLDLSGARMRGTPPGTPLDENAGYGIVITGCRGVTIRGGELGGFKACIVVEDSSDVTIEDVRFDGWYGQRLLSSVAAENPADWLSPHENDASEWVREYGAAISATDCERVTVRRCHGRHGQNGILFTRTAASEVYDNDFSFLSGWGLGMYRSSHNVVSHNLFDYCVRGYSHGVYWRGQDSAGILMFERCSDNVVAFNSATHSGDGVFVFAGNDLVDGRASERGEEQVSGCDRNLFYGNDLRFAVANALEATFSRENLIVGNDLSGCHQHGVWGGYSSATAIVGNVITDTLGGGVTIEHGQECVIADNRIESNEMGVELYWDPDPQFVDGAFGAQRDTASRDHWIAANTFADNAQDVVLKRTSGVVFDGNTYSAGSARPYVDRLGAEGHEEAELETVRSWMASQDGGLPSGHFSQSTLRPPTGEVPELLARARSLEAPAVPGSLVPRAEERGVRAGGLETIVMGEWGPWDHRSGEARPAHREPGGLLAHVLWDAAWFRWDPEASDPRGDLSVWRALADEPLVEARVTNWKDPFGEPRVREALDGGHFGLVATTRLVLESAGSYAVTVISDDGVRLAIDGVAVVEDWTWHAPRRASAVIELDAGEHDLVLEYFQIDGATALTVELAAQ